MDKFGKLYISDGTNNRVLVFNTPIDSTADYVYGQNGSFTSATSGTSTELISGPKGILVDHDGNLLLSDYNNNRILRFLNTDGASVFFSVNNLDFGLVDVGTPDTLDFTIMNDGTDSLFIDSIYIQNSHMSFDSVFAVLDTMDTIAVGISDTMSVRVAFSQGTAGVYSDLLVVYHRSGSASPVDSTFLAIKGSSTILNFSSTAGHFGGVLVDSLREVAMLTIKNISTSDTVQVTGATPSDAQFTITSPSFPVDIYPDSAKSIIVRFLPTGEGEVTGNITFTTNDPGVPNYIFDVFGIGINPNAGRLSFVEYIKDDSLSVDGLDGARNIAISPDGEYVYITGFDESALAVFSRDAVTGNLTFVEVHKDGVGGVDGLNNVVGVTVSPDGRHVYTAGYTDNKVAVFRRNSSTGALTFLEYYEDGTSGIDGLAGATYIECSPDGGYVYVTGNQDDAVAVFERDHETGALSFLEMHKDGVGDIGVLDHALVVRVSPDGKNVYTTAGLDKALLVFSRNISTGTLTFIEYFKDDSAGVSGLDGARGLVLSPDGRNVYVAGVWDSTVVVFSRDTGDGSLTYMEYFKDDSAGVDGLAEVYRINISPDGRYLYAASIHDSALAVFSRDITNGSLTYIESIFDDALGVDGLSYVSDVIVSPDGKHVYAAGAMDDAIAIFKVKQFEIFGDVDEDGSIDALDASYVLKHCVGKILLTGIGLGAADVSGNGSIFAYDASLILQYVAGLITTFPAGSTFVAKPAINMNSYAELNIKETNEEIVELFITLNNVTDVYSTDIVLSYDNSLFELENYEMLIEEKNAMIECNDDNEKGEIKLAIITTIPISNNKSIINLRFKIKGDANGKLPVLENIVINEEIIEVKDSPGIPKVFQLHQNYPNPFNPVTTIKFDLPKTSDVSLKIYNILGQEIRTLIDNNKNAGYHSINWNGTNNLGIKVASGVYIYRIRTSAGYVMSKKMVLLK